MTKQQFINTIRIFGVPLDITLSHWSPSIWDNDFTVELIWKKEHNIEIIKKKMIGETPFLSASPRGQIILKRFRHNGSKTSAKNRAERKVERLRKWVEEYITKE